ncbi:hypothetical protein ZIOFF_030559 [Zingiber officinale]|uniref:Amino acid transporter transmembrane domain-containing protein n=1 Tax=Zingiber officinale TaxID=94328 RepID=A0A8J5GR50_ZINOF|nr:hypothetical protein ZIOFF_030559 [Zingiber officinale]
MAENDDDQQTATALEKQNAIDDWLPITSSRNAKWWFSAFHNVTAMVGAGVLSLPFALSELGWGPGVAILVTSWIITLYTLWQMVEMHEMVPGKRFDRYHELGQHVFGEKLGLWIIVPQQLMVEVGVNIVYMVTGGKSLKKFHELVCPNCSNIKLSYFIMIFASVQLVLAQLPNMNSISGISLAAAVMSLSYSTIAWVASANKGKQPDVDFGYKASTKVGAFFNFLSALGDVAFSYAGHNVVLEIQATIPSTPEKPSKKPMWKGVVVAYLVVAICYFPVAILGYWTFGNAVDDHILMTLQKPTWLIAAANMFVAIHVIGSYQIYAMGVFDMLETLLVTTFRLHLESHFAWLLGVSTVHNVRRHCRSLLRRLAWILRRLCICPDNLLHPLHHVANCLQAQKVRLILDGKLDLHCSGSVADGLGAYWRLEVDHSECRELPVLLLSLAIDFLIY